MATTRKSVNKVMAMKLERDRTEGTQARTAGRGLAHPMEQHGSEWVSHCQASSLLGGKMENLCVGKSDKNRIRIWLH